jgi:hypothetical protein
VVADSGAFNLDDISAEIAKEHRGVWTGQGFRQFDNPDSFEDRGHGGRIYPSGFERKGGHLEETVRMGVLAC